MKAVQTRTYIGLFGIFILFVILNVLTSQFFHGARLDLTEEKLYTLSNGSIKITKDLKEPIILKYYFSTTDSSNIPVFRAYGERVLDLLKSYEKKSDFIRLEIYDPRPDSEEAEWAEKYGLAPIQIQTGDVLFCGLVILNEMGDEEILPFFDSTREEFLEYDISKTISSISNASKTIIGLYSSLDLEGTSNMNPQAPQGSEPWYFLQDLRQMYDVRILNNLSQIDPEINLLVIIHPKDLDQQSEFAIDQYILSGKSTLILVDSFCEADTPAPNPQNPMMAMGAKRSSSLPMTLQNAGLKLSEEKIILDRERATQVQTGPGQIVNYYAWLNLLPNDTNNNDATTGKLETMLFPTSGFFEIDQEKTKELTIEKLITSSKTASKGDISLLLFGGSPEKISKAYTVGSYELPIALRVSGKLHTAFPDGLKQEEKKEEDRESSQASKNFIKQTENPNLILVSDVDFISNRFSLNVTNLFGNILLTPLNDNLNFFFNSMESLSGSTNLIEIRSRGKFTRPFSKVQKIEAKAQAKWKNEESLLTQKVDEANQKINSLMKQEDTTSPLENHAILNEIKKFRKEKLETQEKLRQVKKNLRQEKEALGTQIFLFNTFLIPFLFLLYGLYHLIIQKKT